MLNSYTFIEAPVENVFSACLFCVSTYDDIVVRLNLFCFSFCFSLMCAVWESPLHFVDLQEDFPHGLSITVRKEKREKAILIEMHE